MLQVNAKPSEFGAANSARPLVSLGELSALRVRAELEEQDYGIGMMTGLAISGTSPNPNQG